MTIVSNLNFIFPANFQYTTFYNSINVLKPELFHNYGGQSVNVDMIRLSPSITTYKSSYGNFRTFLSIYQRLF